ncbi:hypothetical protein EJ04DRAFT_569123 [Polyplosphaeria fusca]|uniref:Uncharacterized protein n=1 Tax=Polyplosphaeria fusca TaxID=682080 RepID=A0A9P4UXI8_9PLEO|nr:hypothetical protein EJ04DRAFT_569123 [Polyplosphaeria fusca]
MAPKLPPKGLDNGLREALPFKFERSILDQIPANFSSVRARIRQELNQTMWSLYHDATQSIANLDPDCMEKMQNVRFIVENNPRIIADHNEISNILNRVLFDGHPFIPIVQAPTLKMEDRTRIDVAQGKGHPPHPVSPRVVITVAPKALKGENVIEAKDSDTKDSDTNEAQNAGNDANEAQSPHGDNLKANDEPIITTNSSNNADSTDQMDEDTPDDHILEQPYGRSDSKSQSEDDVAHAPTATANENQVLDDLLDLPSPTSADLMNIAPLFASDHEVQDYIDNEIEGCIDSQMYPQDSPLASSSQHTPTAVLRDLSAALDTPFSPPVLDDFEIDFEPDWDALFVELSPDALPVEYIDGSRPDTDYDFDEFINYPEDEDMAQPTPAPGAEEDVEMGQLDEAPISRWLRSRV